MATVQLAKLAAVTALDTAKAPKADAALTGTTSVQTLSPDIADLGTVASGDVTLSTTKAVNKVVLSGSAATVVLPSTPPDGWRSLVVSVTGNVALAITTPSLYRIDTPSLGAVTSVAIAAATAGKAILNFLAVGGSFVGMTVIGDETIEIPVIQTDAGATPTSGEVFSTSATLAAIAAYVDSNGVGIDYTPAALPANEIDGSLGTLLTKTVTANTNFTYANFIEGKEYEVELTNTGSYTATWPTTAWAGGSTPTLTTGSKMDRFYIRLRGGVYFGRVVQNFTVDTTEPTVSSSAIDVTGGFIDITLSENGQVGIGGSGGFALSTGEALTFVSITDDVLRYSILPLVEDGDTPTLAYTQPGNGIEDVLGNDLATFSGAAITNGSSYTASTNLLKVDFEDGYPAAAGVTGTVNNAYTTTVLEGTKSAAISANNSNTYWTYTGQTDVWAHCRYRHTGHPTSENSAFTIRDASGAALALFRPGASGSVKFYANGSDTSASAFTLAVDTTYYVWIHYDESATSTLYVGTSTTRPSVDGAGTGAVLSKTAGAGTAARIQIARGANGGTFIYDNIIVRASEIGDNPS